MTTIERRVFEPVPQPPVSEAASLLLAHNEIQARLVSRQHVIDKLITEQNQDQALSINVREQYRLAVKRAKPHV